MPNPIILHINLLQTSQFHLLDKVEIWDGESPDFARVAKVNIYRVPLHLWDANTFNAIGKALGTIVCPSTASGSDRNLTSERILILTKKLERINETVTLEWRGRKFCILLMEDDEDWLPAFLTAGDVGITGDEETDTGENRDDVGNSNRQQLEEREDGEILKDEPEEERPSGSGDNEEQLMVAEILDNINIDGNINCHNSQDGDGPQNHSNKNVTEVGDIQMGSDPFGLMEIIEGTTRPCKYKKRKSGFKVTRCRVNSRLTEYTIPDLNSPGSSGSRSTDSRGSKRKRLAKKRRVLSSSIQSSHVDNWVNTNKSSPRSQEEKVQSSATSGKQEMNFISPWLTVCPGADNVPPRPKFTFPPTYPP